MSVGLYRFDFKNSPITSLSLKLMALFYNLIESSLKCLVIAPLTEQGIICVKSGKCP